MISCFNIKISSLFHRRDLVDSSPEKTFLNFIYEDMDENATNTFLEENTKH
jgi:hypothetical protein